MVKQMMHAYFSHDPPYLFYGDWLNFPFPKITGLYQELLGGNNKDGDLFHNDLYPVRFLSKSIVAVVIVVVIVVFLSMITKTGFLMPDVIYFKMRNTFSIQGEK